MDRHFERPLGVVTSTLPQSSQSFLGRTSQAHALWKKYEENCRKKFGAKSIWWFLANPPPRDEGLLAKNQLMTLEKKNKPIIAWSHAPDVKRLHRDKSSDLTTSCDTVMQTVVQTPSPLPACPPFAPRLPWSQQMAGQPAPSQPMPSTRAPGARGGRPRRWAPPWAAGRRAPCGGPPPAQRGSGAGAGRCAADIAGVE